MAVLFISRDAKGHALVNKTYEHKYTFSWKLDEIMLVLPYSLPLDVLTWSPWRDGVSLSLDA